VSTADRVRRFAERLRAWLAEVDMVQIDERLGWKAGQTASVLQQGDGLRMADLLAILEAAGFDERSFFASVYGLDASSKGPRGGEVPYSTGRISNQDAAEFPPAEEVIGLVRTLVGQETGLRRSGKAQRGIPPLDEPDLTPEPPKKGTTT
jgi:hypothetical protein